MAFHHRRGRGAVATLAGLAVFIGLTGAGIRYGPSPIAGDEMEYYAMTYAWATNGSPTLTPAVVSAIRAAIPGRPYTEPAMARALDGSYNAIHFWFLSLLATPFFRLCAAVGLDWRHCFAILNALLFAAVVTLAYRWFRWFGVLVLIGGLLDSPLVTYLNKAHGEAYTVSLAAIAALCMVTGRWLAAALALAAISVQVSAFSPLTVLALGKWAFDQHKFVRGRLSARQLAGAGACVGLLALQPLWTLWRYHKLNLIIAEGFVIPEMATARRIASMLLDPDVGFFFVWPLGILLLLLFMARLVREPSLLRRYWGYWAFLALLVAEVAYIGAEQMNYTTSAPRYSLWYIPFLLTGFLAASQMAEGRSMTVTTFFVLGAIATGGYLFLIAGVSPNLQRKPLAELWYRYLPGAWDPPEQVFADISLHEQLESGRDLFFKRRFPIDQLLDPETWALSNRSCTKLLVFGFAFTSSRVDPLLPLGCEAQIDGQQLLRYVRSVGGSGMEDRYVTVNLAKLGGMAAPPGELDWPEHMGRNTEDRAPKVETLTKGDPGQSAFTFLFSDPDGWQDLNVAMMMIGPMSDGKLESSCYITYSLPRHELAMVRENGSISPGMVPGRHGDLKSRWCQVDMQAVSIAAAGETLTVKLPVRLDRALAAAGVAVRAQATDLDQRTSGWVLMGDSRLAANPRRPPEVAVAGERNAVRIGFSYDEPHAREMARIWVLMNDKRSEENACYFEFEPVNGMVRLMPDNGDGVAAPAARLGGKRQLENGRCILDAQRSGTEGNRDGMKIQLNVIRKDIFAAAKRMWIRYQESDGTLTAWQEAGISRGSEPLEQSTTATLERDSDRNLLHLQLRYEVSGGRAPARIWVLVNDRLEAGKSCYLTYEPAARAIYLNEAGENGAPGRMLLADGRMLTNSQCQVDGRESIVNQTAGNVDLRLRVTRKGVFRGPKRVWAADQENDGERPGKVSPWVPAGTWRW